MSKTVHQIVTFTQILVQIVEIYRHIFATLKTVFFVKMNRYFWWKMAIDFFNCFQRLYHAVWINTLRIKFLGKVLLPITLMYRTVFKHFSYLVLEIKLWFIQYEWENFMLNSPTVFGYPELSNYFSLFNILLHILPFQRSQW